ncbi:MAG: 4Fe-4S dicluster domain-containing protein [Flavobacteriales bacterium]
MAWLSSLIFVLTLGVAIFLFTRRIGVIRRNIQMGGEVKLEGSAAERWALMARVALGQGKMTARPVAGIMHIIIYLGFVIINIEILEILIDGLFGTHRVFSFLGPVYNALIASFEVLAAGVLLACAVFFVRRNGMAIARFRSPEMGGWPSLDANIILVVEVLLMFAFLSMNAADCIAQSRGLDAYVQAGAFPVSQWLTPLYSGLSDAGIVMVERGMWWFHIVGVLAFLVYVPYSKHFHILLAFPNTWYASLQPHAALNNMAAVKKEVDLMMDPNADPYAAAPAGDEPPARFGVKDASDLTWIQLMQAYSCTECGRCTSSCPANQTGKKLSPRKIMMDTRDRIEEIGKSREAAGGKWDGDGKSLLGNYITEEELWACTSCQACVEACPILISPMGIILDMRRSLIMEDSKSPESITSMFNNIENNGAPWAFPAAGRGDWRTE